MSGKKESKTPKLTKNTAERLTAFYEWASNHEFTLKDMEAVLCGVVIQAEIAGFRDSITIGNKTFDIMVKLSETQVVKKKKSK